jgi:hypothetical protein
VFVSDFFEELETQRRRELGDVAVVATIGVLAVVAATRFLIDPSSAIDYIPALGAALPSACIAAGIIEHRQS